MFEPEFRYQQEEIKQQYQQILGSNYFSVLMDELPDLIIIINKARQIVYANKSFFNQFEIAGKEDLWGQRPGEYMNCIRPTDSLHGCGSTPHCNACGFSNLLNISSMGVAGEGECHMLIEGGLTLSFTVNTREFNISNQEYIFCLIKDITSKKAHEFLERSFLHDIQNSICVLYAMHDIIDELEPNETRKTLKDLAVKLNEEINAYKLISSAENKRLKIRPEVFDISQLVSNTCEELQKIQAFRNRQVSVVSNAKSFITDKILLRRVIMNLIKNALEASGDNEPIDITIDQNQDAKICTIKVKSIPLIAEKVQLQMFQKTFSTKGRGRGWGTYSIRLLTEHYLKGSVTFVSNAQDRTVFTLKIPQWVFAE